MSKYIPNTTYDLALNQLNNVDHATVCSTQPTTYYNAIWADMWVADTAYDVGDEVRSPTDNDMVYECTVAGTSGSSEPAWGEVQDATFADGTATWKTHDNYSLAKCEYQPSDKTIQDRAGGGREIVFAEKSGIVSHRAGTVTHTAYYDSVNKTLEYVTTTTTTAPADDDIISGRTTIFHSNTVGLYIE